MNEGGEYATNDFYAPVNFHRHCVSYFRHLDFHLSQPSELLSSYLPDCYRGLSYYWKRQIYKVVSDEKAGI